jgi:predicted RNA-binding Zn ribbon-like protein
MTDAERHFGRESRVGGAVCLDFVNTLHWRGTGATIERLTTYDDLLSWATYGNLVEAPQAMRLRELAQARPEEAAHVLRRAWTLREGLHRVVTAEMQRREPAEDDMALLNGELGAALEHAILTRVGDSYRLGWRGLDKRLDAPLWHVTRSAADLLTSPLRTKIRLCANEACGWLFIDESKNASRRWCSMELCGSRRKMREYYRRKHGRPTTAGQSEA